MNQLINRVYLELEIYISRNSTGRILVEIPLTKLQLMKYSNYVRKKAQGFKLGHVDKE